MIEDIEDSRSIFLLGYNGCSILHRVLRQDVLSASALARGLSMTV